MRGKRTLYLAQIAVVAAVYYGAAKLGLSLAFATSSVTAVWPPTGIALAAVVIWGRRIWPGVALGAFLANSWTGVPLYTTAGITVGNTLEAVVGGYLLWRVAFDPALRRVRDVLALVFLAAMVSTAVSATIGVGSLLIGDEINAADIGSVWRTWWLGDMGGDLLVAPVLMVAFAHWPFVEERHRPLEAGAVAALVAGVSVLVFTQGTSLSYLIFPPLIWAAMRFWQPGATAASLMVAAIAVIFTDHDQGPFSGHSPDDRLLLAQTFVAVAGVSTLVLAAVVSERDRTERVLRYIARTLQESLLPPRLPHMPGLETAALFRPAGEPFLVGGDFYDLFESEDGSWAVVVADVCGKGPPAAAATSLARYTIRAAAAQDARPGRVLTALNEAILRQRGAGEFCTVAYARLDLRRTDPARLTFSTGGHPLPLVLRANGGVEVLGKHGTVIGVVREPDFEEHSAQLFPGDALVLYTDGLTEAHAPERVLTARELITALAACRGEEAAAIGEHLTAAAVNGRSGGPRDDIAVLVLRVIGEEEHRG